MDVVVSGNKPLEVTQISRALPRATGVSRALRTRCSQKSLKRVSRGLWPGAPKSLEKVSKKSEKSGKSLENVCSGLFETFSRLFGTPRPEAAGDSSQTFLGISGPEGPRDSCSSREGSELKSPSCTQLDSLRGAERERAQQLGLALRSGGTKSEILLWNVVFL